MSSAEIRAIIEHAQALVFDFDGTLVDSVPIKREGFATCFRECRDQFDDIMAYCLWHHHVPRGEKFRYVYERILRQPYTSDIAAQLHARFEAATTQQILSAPEIPGASRFLAAVSRERLTALLSNTPHPILLDILRRRGWEAYFRYIQGAPVDKAAWLRQLARQERLTADRIVFFGDTKEDAEAGRQAGCAFVAVKNQELAGHGHVAITNFLEGVAPCLPSAV